MDFGPLAVLVGVALVGPILAATGRFGPPVVVGQIAAGIAIGTSGLRLVDPSDPFLSGLAGVGFAVLMFVVGTHIPLRDRRLRSSLLPGLGLTLTLAALAIATGQALAPHVGLDRPAVLAVLIMTSSGAVVLPVLQGLSDGGTRLLVATVWVASADVVTVVALSFVLATGAIERVLGGGGLVIAVAVILYLTGRSAARNGWVRRARRLSHDRSWGLDLRVSLLALFATAWIATRFGTSVLIAGFAIGAVVSLLGEPRRVAQQLIGVGEGFVIPVFFVHLGAQLDLGALWRSPEAIRLTAALAVGSIAAHVLAVVVWRLPVGLGLLASAQLGVPAAAASIGLRTGQLTAAQASALMAAALVTLIASALGGVLVGHKGPLPEAVAPGPETHDGHLGMATDRNPDRSSPEDGHLPPRR